jgi:phosphoenolpyruvate-protein phosphotransferase (PTS system enzyme I)
MELKGIGVSPGIAVGPALVVEREAVPVLRLLLPPEAVPLEEARLSRAVAASRDQLQSIRARLSREVGLPHAYIFDAHLLMLEDPLLLDRAQTVIREEHVNAEWALRTVAERLHTLFGGLEDAYLRERRTDLADVLGRILLNLGGAGDAPSLARLPGSFVVVARDLTPSEAAELDWERVQAVALDAGSATYHTAILAKSFGVPAVVGLGDGTRRIPPGSLVVVDGTRGHLVVEPTGPVLAGFREAQERDRLEDVRLQQMQPLPAVTTDGVAVVLRANVEFPDEASAASVHGALGIGLFRSEYLLGRSREWPSEDRQVEVYARLLEQMHPHPVTVRTWDVGPEDLSPGGPTSANPALGERAFRLVPRAPEAFRAQLRALLRASARGPLRILFPFVAGTSDLRLVLGLLAEARADLAAAGLAPDSRVEVGINIEVPSAALTADLLAPDVDFLSIGTNDLVQYLLAADRDDPRVSAHYQPLHPAVLRTIRQVVLAGAPRGLPVSVCGEMAADPLQALALLGLGVRELSMSPAAVPRVKAAIRAASAAELQAVAGRCLSLPTAAAVEAELRHALGMAPDGDAAPAGRVAHEKE